MSVVDMVQTIEEQDYPNHADEATQDHNLEPGSPKETPGQQHARPTRISTSFQSPTLTPSMRTGPPRSLSYAYSVPNSPIVSRNDSHRGNRGIIQGVGDDEAELQFSFSRKQSDFRGALEFTSSEQSDRKGKKRESRLEESWNPMRWFDAFHESPKEEKSQFDFEGKDETKGGKSSNDAISDGEHKADDPQKSQLRRAFSVPHSPQEKHNPGRAKWGRLRSLLPSVVSQGGHPSALPAPSAVTHHSVNITDELITGGLSTLMLRLWFERDEKGHRRVPVLFHRLRIRVSDSLHPLHDHRSVFRIECEYANGAARWVIYRQLRDFLSLHTHYAFSNAYNRTAEKLPEFPRTSLPYFKFLKRENRDSHIGHAEVARLQREALENYLIDLIRAVMFHPSSNRLAGFLEISALFISLAQSGGAQYKAGYLHIELSGNKGGGFGRKSASWQEKKEQRWCAVRESYLVALQEPGELAVWDVFILDQDFRIERPKRYYRQRLNLLHHDADDQVLVPRHEHKLHVPDEDNVSRIGSIRSTLSKVFHIGDHRKQGSRPNRDVVSGDGDDTSSGTSEGTSRVASPMLDPSTNVNPLASAPDQHGVANPPRPPIDSKKKKRITDVSKHTFYIENSQMRLKLFARNERQMLQWITALEKVAARSHFTVSNRFDSFAPIRVNVAAQWLVDGRDYFWNLSRAILLARESIYIHDWWLSPELQMRRPNKDRYRLDRLLERKAKEGVKIHVILYQEVSNRTTPTDSNYTKQRLASLHPNVMIQRSPSHFQTGTFYWAHHEKLCVIDQAIAFMGGVDLCFGRWDTPQHVLIDDVDAESGTSEIWPGKDYSNPRITDFYNLHKPEEDMYDRSKVPRMPWHDVGLQVVGQPARDLARHFVQRWNYLLRIKNHSRIMPFLLPPPEFKPGELTRMGLTGTCDMQICRSAGPWSLGTPNRIEHSIEHAYLKAIQMSEHFVYIENQFFITSTVVNDVRIENRIGDALVHRIIRAYHEGTPWKCCIMIPLLPGFTFPVDHSDASALRIILECQNRTIARGPNSIFGRLRKEGIDPDEYISVFSLRNWAKLRGDVLTTEQVYIHGKVCIVDDRLAIIGSANINERSQRGDRDSELAAVIRDTDMIDCTMAGMPFKVGRFAHTLRVRLMREHVGVDVDALDDENLMVTQPSKPEREQDLNPAAEQEDGREEGITHVKQSQQRTVAGHLLHETASGTEHTYHTGVDAPSGSTAQAPHRAGEASEQTAEPAGGNSLGEERDDKKEPGFVSTRDPTVEEKVAAEHHPLASQADEIPILVELNGVDASSGSHQASTTDANSKLNGELTEVHTENGDLYSEPKTLSRSAASGEILQVRSGVNNTDDEEKAGLQARRVLGKHLKSNVGSKVWTLPTKGPLVDPNGFEDPIKDSFWKDVWVASAVHNTGIFRKVFHAIPDDLITTWKQYKEFVMHHERLYKPLRDHSTTPEPVARLPMETANEAAPSDSQVDKVTEILPGEEPRPGRDGRSRDGHEESPEPLGTADKDAKARRPGRGPEPFEKWERDEMEKLLGELNGHLVLYPTHFLEGEDVANNFLFNADRLLPLPIYN